MNLRRSLHITKNTSILQERKKPITLGGEGRRNGEMATGKKLYEEKKKGRIVIDNIAVGMRAHATITRERACKWPMGGGTLPYSIEVPVLISSMAS